MAKVRLFLSKLIINTIGKSAADDLLDDFRLYKEKGILPSTFGRDAPYDRTHNRSYLELQHIHIKRNGESFPVRLVQFSRKSGHVLVYCPGFYDRNTYLLITVIKHWNQREPNDIEGTDHDSSLMAKLEKIAEGFREKF
ncbi:type II toxin-antitoxin system YafO family toxin [Endozoicomonas arenosclerae]|uniref:type II toxin-antitoxin system YafO family toxin n=1 Tax=Endozoicomonas arenosclerae TaxID=1633495 RepID=UPI000782A44F|nr:type II toxin-antitoxin system YafO family toxin [Endozoicomonas arenosclerae]